MTKKTQANNKTQPAGDIAAVHKFIDGVTHEGRRADAHELLELMQTVTGEAPVMWGPSIIGFGRYHYEYDSGREGDAPLVGFSPRKANMVVYIMPGFGAFDGLLAKLGKHKLGKSCLYLGRLKTVDTDVLGKLTRAAVTHMRKKYGVAKPN